MSLNSERQECIKHKLFTQSLFHSEMHKTFIEDQLCGRHCLDIRKEKSRGT